MQAWETMYAAPGLFFGRIANVRVVFIGPLISDADFTRFLELLASDIDESPDTRKMGVFYHVPDRASNMERRQAIGMTLKKRNEKLAKITAGYVMVTSSFIVRGVLKAIWWMAPPPYPSSVVTVPEEGFAYLAAQMPGEDSDFLVRSYAALHKTNAWLTDANAPRLVS